MDKGKHPKVVRVWMTGKLKKAAPGREPWRKPTPATPHKPEPHNKT